MRFAIILGSLIHSKFSIQEHAKKNLRYTFLLNKIIN